MKRMLAFGLLLCVLAVGVLQGSSVTKSASWSDPEPLGITATAN